MRLSPGWAVAASTEPQTGAALRSGSHCWKDPEPPAPCKRLGPRPGVGSDSWSQCYKTFYGRNLRFFIIIRVSVPGKPFQPSLMFACKAGAYPTKAVRWKLTDRKLTDRHLSIVVGQLSESYTVGQLSGSVKCRSVSFHLTTKAPFRCTTLG